MIARLTFFSITAFWLAMNVLLWRAEYGSHSGETPVPPDLVWRKILTAPDASSLTLYQNGERTGFCEFSTSVEQEMATLDEDKPPPEGLVARAGYQIRLDGNVSLNDFTNRLRFDGRVKFSPKRAWSELSLKLNSRFATVEIQAFATNQTVHLAVFNGGETVQRTFAFADLQNPNALLSSFAGNFGDRLPEEFELPVVPPTSTALTQRLPWDARRVRVRMGREWVSVYRLETRLLGNQIVIFVSTLGEILRVDLPGGVIAKIDEWSNP